jgi:anti-sigma factor RsiW
MTQDLHTMTGAYALDALDELERRQFEAHLATCEACPEEVRGLIATGARLGVAAAVSVPASLHDAVMAQVATTRQLPPVLDPSVEVGRVLPMLRRARTTSRALLAVAAALVVIAGALGGVAVQQQHRAVRVEQASAAISTVLAAPDAKQSQVDGARVWISPALDRAVFVGQKMPVVDASHALQLWVLGDGTPRSVGLVHDGTPVVADGVRPGLTLGVTIEPAGGSTQPTTSPVMTLPLT